MQIVIDIPKGIYENIQRRWNKVQQTEKYTLGYVLGYALEKAVVNGIPLPKGHGRLIDADEIQFENAEFDTYGDYSRAFDAIDEAETIIEADKESDK